MKTYKTQNYNKYGYVMNNPLMFNDPSGEFFEFIGLGIMFWKAVIIGAAVGLVSYSLGVAIAGQKWNFGNAMKSMFFGAVSGAVTCGIGDLFKVASVVKAVGNAKFLIQGMAHGVSQGVLSVVQGGKFLSGAAAGFFGNLGAEAWGASMKGLGLEKFASSTVGTISFGALSGGVGAELTGGNFWQGAIIGGIVAGLNHAMHSTANRLEKSDLEFDLQNAKDGDPKLFEKLRQHYEAKTGKPLTLTKEEFLHMMKTAVSEKLIDYSKAKCVDGSCTATVDFYKSSSNDLKLSFGRATVKFYYNKDGHAVLNGFYDKYDFDPKPWGTRSVVNEIITRAYSVYSSGKAFEIKYP